MLEQFNFAPSNEMSYAVSNGFFSNQFRSIVSGSLHRKKNMMDSVITKSKRDQMFCKRRHFKLSTTCAQTLVLLAVCIVFLSIIAPNLVESSTSNTATISLDEVHHVVGAGSSNIAAESGKHHLFKRSAQFTSNQNNHHHHHSYVKHLSSDSLPSTNTITDGNTHDHHHSHPRQHRRHRNQYQRWQHSRRINENEIPRTHHIQSSQHEKESYNNNESNLILQQVPEQLSIVVNSNSDNSYVSASPLEFTTTSTNYGSKITDSNLDSTHMMQHELHQHAHGFAKGHHLRQARNRRLQTNSNTKSDHIHSRIPESRYSSDEIVSGRKSGNHIDHQQNDQHLGRGDISTTATTTPRYNNIRMRQEQQNLVQVTTDSSSSEEYNYADDEEILDNNNDLKVDQTISSNYHVRQAYIIKTKESIKSGATFLNYTLVTSLNACLVECWITDSCDTAVYQESPVEFNSNHLPIPENFNPHLDNLSKNPVDGALNYGENLGLDDGHQLKEAQEVEGDEKQDIGFFICYLFQCSKSDGFKCHFSTHNYYVSATARKFITFDSAPSSSLYNTLENESRESFSDTTTGPSSTSPTIDFSFNPTDKMNENQRQQIFACGQEQFKCHSNDECISNNQLCDGIVQCSDNSDEMRCTDGMLSYFNIGSRLLPTTTISSSKNNDDISVQLNPEQSSKTKIVGSDNDQVQIKELGPSLDTRIDGYSLDNSIANRARKQLDEIDMNKVEKVVVNLPHYSHIVNGLHTVNKPESMNSKHPWHNYHIASINIKQEQYDTDYDGRGGLNSAIIAFMFGIGVTGMLVMIVGHKMKSIRRRIAYKGRRRSLVPDTDFLINTIPM